METSDESRKRVKRKFVIAWLNDNRYKSWIRQVLSSDNSLYFCIICNKTFSCSSPVSKHVDSACHKKNSKENNATDSKNETPRTIRTFRQQWLDIHEFKPWLREVSNNKSVAFCTICNKMFTCGTSQIYRHAESQMHRKKLEENIEANKLNTDLSMQYDESCLSFHEQKKSAEIQFAAVIAEHNISHQTANAILKVFQQIDNPKVVKNMSMGRTKCHNIISKVLCPVETERVIHNIQNTKFSIFIDETSDLTNEKWMTFFVRYVDSESLDVRSQLVKLIDIDARDCSAEKLFNAFQSEMYKFQIPFTNILSLSCDNASVTGKHVSFNLFNFFNAFFQAHETRIHLLHSKSVNFLLQISKHFLKPEALNHGAPETQRSAARPRASSGSGEMIGVASEIFRIRLRGISSRLRKNCITVETRTVIRARSAIGPYFLPPRLTGQLYAEFLANQLPALLEDVPLDVRAELIFQHDGAPAHFSRQVRNLLDARFPDRWMGRGGPIIWPARSPDLNVLDYFVWGYIKTAIEDRRDGTEQEVREAIVAAFDTITPDMAHRATRNITRRAEICVREGGRHFEQFLH
ncbi:hypothetical protein X777_06645 [Ooceraea biroi]|uniref:C2H2-type domain-containing protein n=2 Tax=Ooceraea biroi TaxID=2015173 RepID=A0A026WDT3_OOCBI|nr:hypothetical protein X777_06645 [Ooceraea biroi]